MVDVDSEDSSSEEDERFTKEPLVTFEAPVNEEDSSSEDAEEEVFEFVKKGDEDKAEVILKSALVTDDQSSEDEAVEDGESQIAIPTEEVQQVEATANVVDTEEKQPVVNFDFDQQVQPADNRLNALDYPEDSGNADSSAPSSLESQSGPASVIVESQEVPTPDSAAFILTTTESSSLDNLPTPQEAVIEVLPGTEVAQSPILEESEELEDSDDKSAEIPVDVLEPKETEQPTFDVIAPSTEEDLITEEKAALSSLEEAINSAAESDQEAIIESEVRPETPKDIDIIDGNSKELSDDVINEPLVTNAAPVDLLASIEQNGINEPFVEKVQENPALVKFEDNPLVETIQESFDEKVEEPVVDKEEAPTFEQIDEQSQIKKEIEVTNTDIIEKEDEQQSQTPVENFDTEIEKEEQPLVEKTESIVVDDEPSSKVEVQPTFEEPTVAVCHFEPVTDAFAKETHIEEQSALKVDDLIDTEPISIEKSEEVSAPVEITDKSLDLLATEIPIQEPVTFTESLIETKEIETLPESTVEETESRFQATPDDFEKEYTINVKEDQFNMSEAVPEPMPQPIVEVEPTIETKEALETSAPVTTSEAAEIPIEEPIVDKDDVPTIEQTHEQQPQIEKEIEVINNNLTEEQPKEPALIEEVPSKIENESMKVEEVTPEIVVDEAPKIEQEEIVKPVEEPEAVKTVEEPEPVKPVEEPEAVEPAAVEPVEEPEAVKIEPPSIEETPKEIPVEEPEKLINEDKAAAAVAVTATAVAVAAGATAASKAVSKKATSSTATTAGAKKAPLNKPGAKPTAAASPKPTRSTTSRAPLASRSTAASKPTTSSTTSRTAPLTKKPVSAPSSRPSSATSKPPVPKADVKPRAKPVSASSSTAAPKTTRPTTTRPTAPKPASPAPRVRPTNTVSKAPVPRTTTSRLASTAPKDDKKVNAVKSATPTTSRTASPVKARPTSGTTRAPPLKNGTADVKPRVTKAPVTSTRATTRSTVSSTTTKPATTKTTTTTSRTATRPTASSTAARTTTRTTTTTTKTVPATRKPISGAPNNRATAGGPLAKKAAVTKTKPTPTNVAPEKKPPTKETEVAETKVNGDLNGHPEPATNGDAPKEVNVEI